MQGAALSDGDNNEGTADGKGVSMRRLQGLLYTRERELRACQLRVQSLESQVQVRLCCNA